MFEAGDRIQATSIPNDLTPTSTQRASRFLHIETSIREKFIMSRGRHQGSFAYYLEVDGSEFTWYEENLSKVSVEIIKEKDLLPINTIVESKYAEGRIYKIIEVKPINTKQDYRIKCQNKKENDIFISHSNITLLSNEELLKKWGLQNIDKGNLPNPFDNYKYPIKYIEYKTKDKLEEVETPEGISLRTTQGKVFKKICIILTESTDRAICDRTVAYYENDKLTFTSFKGCKAIHIKNIENYQELLISDLCKAKIKSIDASVKLFSNRNKKGKMLVESQNDNKTFTIRNIMCNYLAKKNDEIVNIVEIDTGEISLKFKLDDIELITPDLRGYSIRKNRDIEKDCVCTIVNNKHLKLQKGAKVKILDIKNVTFGKIDRYSLTPSKKYYKNSVVSALTEDNKQIICRIRNLKRL